MATAFLAVLPLTEFGLFIKGSIDMASRMV
jgi:hypothetical protein